MRTNYKLQVEAKAMNPGWRVTVSDTWTTVSVEREGGKHEVTAEALAKWAEQTRQWETHAVLGAVTY